MRVAVLGLGEAGSIYAADLHARGASVVGTDLHLSLGPPSVERAADIAAGRPRSRRRAEPGRGEFVGIRPR